MARPRVFISSTFYDLRQIRADLEQFVRSMGYEAVLHERGAIPYGTQEKLEEYAYKEVDTCDILVSVVGGRFGSMSNDDSHSISQKEVKRAIDIGKQVYIFVEASVHAEYETYLLNKEVEGVRYKFVDNVAVFHFIEDMHSLQRNNPITQFTQARDMVEFLREQWAGLFQRFLQQQSLMKEARLLDDMRSTVRTLNQLVTFLTEERRGRDEAVMEILLRNHPLFEALRTLLNVPYRIFLTTIDEFDEWFEGARGFDPVDHESWDDDDFREWAQTIDEGSFRLLKISDHVFDSEGRLRVFTADEWHPEWIKLEIRRHDGSEGDEDYDDEGVDADAYDVEPHAT